jgi:hypothetical protein
MSEIEASTLSIVGREDELERLYRIVDRVFKKIDQRWYFAERNLILDWSETRSLV